MTFTNVQGAKLEPIITVTLKKSEKGEHWPSLRSVNLEQPDEHCEYWLHIV